MTSLSVKTTLIVLLSSWVALGSDFRDEPEHILWLTNAAKKVAPEIDRDHKYNLSFLKKPVRSCKANLKTTQYLVALLYAGQYEKCVELARGCLEMAKSDSEHLAESYKTGAACAQGMKKPELSRMFYQEAISDRFLGNSNYKSLVMDYASFAEWSQYSSQTQSILSYGFDEKAPLAYRFLEYRFKGSKLSESELEGVLKFEEEALSGPDKGLKATVLRARLRYYYRASYEFKKAVDLIAERYDELGSVLAWSNMAFRLFYRLSQRADMTPARIVFDAIYPYFHVRSTLPTENNVYTYSELYSGVCKNQLLSGEAFDQFYKISQEWALGKKGPEETLTDALEMQKKYGEKADLLTLIGTLTSMYKDKSSAKELLWKAHKLCPFYNRANRGIYNIDLHEKLNSYSDSEMRNQRFLQVAETLRFPPEYESYIYNYSALNSKFKKHLAYSLRYWSKLVDDIYHAKVGCLVGYECWATDNFVYVKPSSQMMSDIPTKEHQKDVRTSYDNRLRDDIRGQGGSFVVTEYDETELGHLGVYNLSGHEVAHQAHFAFPENARHCIEVLYANAKKRNVFESGYAGRNSREYFAQGVTHYMIPADSPPRFGINIGWYKKNDPDLYKFLVSVAQAENFDQIKCPIDTSHYRPPQILKSASERPRHIPIAD